MSADQGFLNQDVMALHRSLGMIQQKLGITVPTYPGHPSQGQTLDFSGLNAIVAEAQAIAEAIGQP